MTRTNNNIVIRPIESRDAAQAAQVWCDGLQQTVDALPQEKQEAVRSHFAKMVSNERVKGGMTGVNGEGLIDFYMGGGGSKDRCMFVAVEEHQGDNNEVCGDVDVLGLVGIKRGMDYKKDPAATDKDYNWCSIWKMSVRENARGKGVGSQLMQVCEEWAKERSPIVDAIRLYTGNPIAASFYTKTVGFVEIKKTDHYGIYEKKLTL